MSARSGSGSGAAPQRGEEARGHGPECQPSSEFLTADDLYQLTGYRNPSRQCRVLAESGLRYIKRKDGRPGITWAALHDHQLGIRPRPLPHETPNLEALARGKKTQTR